jgi:hypothetical protein
VTSRPRNGGGSPLEAAMRKFMAAMALLAACGGDDDGGPIEFDDLPGAIIGAYCGVYVNCGLMDDYATCANLNFDVDVDPAIGAAIEAGLVIYHEDQAGACLGGIGTSTCEQNRLFENEPEACDLTFEGTVGAGGQCGIDEECISQDCMVPSCPDACCQGTCVGDVRPPRPRVGESCGESCDRTGSCVDSFCHSMTLVCTAYVALGDTCQETDQCQTGICTGVCTALPDTGETCALADQGACRKIGDFCSPTTMKCTPLGLSGDACTDDGECSPIYKCGSAGTCVLRPRVGEMCGSGRDSCIDGSFCNASSICEAPRADGAACETNSQCIHDCDPATSTCVTEPVCI